MHRILFSLILGLTTISVAHAHEPMTGARVLDILRGLDSDIKSAPGIAEITIADVPVTVIIDERAGRMRAMVPISGIEDLTAKDLTRLMQANFDTALDARYAVAQSRLWGVFIHDIAGLSKDELILGIGQAVNLALTYGDTYSSGVLSFGGGDSGAMLLRDLRERGQEL